MKYDYVLRKIKDAKITKIPFEHIQIKDLFNEVDFEQIVKSREIEIRQSKNDDELFKELFKSGYKIISFPGCIDDKEKYVKWHKTKNVSHKMNTSCEGFGVVLRLVDAHSPVVKELMSFLESSEFKACISEKFGIKLDECSYDHGIQKYLDGYEISPHPDNRKKALTYMVNINPSNNSEKFEHHTQYLKFKPEWEYVKEFWKGNPKVDTCWVPWEWCHTEKTQTQNNSLVIFSPSNDTLHGVKANYDHLIYQRTQLYGNLWYDESQSKRTHWNEYIIDSGKTATVKRSKIMEKIKEKIPQSAKSIIIKIANRSRDSKTHTKRDY